MDKFTPEQVAQYNAYKTKYQSIATEIKAIVEQGRLVASDSTQLFLFKGMYKELKPYFDSFNEAWEGVTTLFCQANAPSEFPTQSEKNIQSAVKRYYYEACAIYEQHMNPTPVPPSTAGATVGQSPSLSMLNDSRTVRARLPQINLPKFSGNQPDWTMFRDTYTSLIHDEPSLSKIEKFHFLLSCLTGPALTLIKGIPLQDASYEQAWKLLNDNYNDKRRLACSYLKTALNFTPFRNKPTASSLKFLLSNVIESITSFQQLKIPNNDNFILLFLVLRCLDLQTRREFEKQYAKTEFPTLENLTDFLLSELRSLELTAEDSQKGSTARGREGTTRTLQASFHASSQHRNSVASDYDSSSSSRPSISGSRSGGSGSTLRSRHDARSICPVCSASHTLYQCSRFRAFSAQERLDSLRSWAGCTNCLSSKHRNKQCTSTRTCQNCNLKHHTWLHVARNSQPEDAYGPAARPPGPNPHQTVPSTSLGGTSNNKEVILGTALVKIMDSRGNYQPVRLVMDCGSQQSFITSACAERLGLPKRGSAPAVTGIGQVQLPNTLGQLNCVLRSRYGDREIPTTAIIVPEITGNLPHAFIPYEYHNLLGAYTLADPTYWKPQPVDFLLGADVYFDVVTDGPIALRQGYPKLTPSLFGHIVAGNCDHTSHQSSPTSLFIETKSSLHDAISKFWEIEEFPPEVPWSEEEKACVEHFASTHYRMPSGRYAVALPFKPTIHNLISPKNQVETRFKKLEYKLERDPALKAEYHKFMEEYLTLNHMTPTADPGRYLVPHHCVTKQENGKMKLRVVFDASCKGPNGSLNDHLMVGPKLQKDLCHIILNFRIRKVVFVADIVKMYRQVLVRPEDRIYQHILWRSSSMGPVLYMQLNTLTYGQSSAAFEAISCLEQLAIDDGAEFPLAVEAIREDVYVDDFITGSDTIEDALLLQSQLVQLLQRGCFELSKWKCNCPELLAPVQGEDQEKSFAINPSENDAGFKILGLQWVPTSDHLTFHIQKPKNPTTKRGILSTIARIFDPMGFLAPVVFQAKVILQQVWLEKCDWDSTVPDSIRLQWQVFADYLPDLSHVKIPRHAAIQEGDNYILGFADASLRGYGAVVYLHTRSSLGCNTHLMKAKTKLAPTKNTSIPRLELCAALLLARVILSCADFVTKVNPKGIFLYTDSTVVLGWLATPTNRLKSFVAHRVIEILQSSQLSSWRHVDSATNPADCASRGLMPHELVHHPLWWSGPTWLLDPPYRWPTHWAAHAEALPELKPLPSVSFLSLKLSDIIDWINRSSSYLKVLRSLSFALRFQGALLNRIRTDASPQNHGAVCLKEMKVANLTCIQLIQRRFLPPLGIMRTSKPWQSLAPFQDARGLLRVGGRLQHSQLSYDAKHPLIMPRCHYTQLLVGHYHKSYLHIGPSALQAMLSSRYYLVSARQVIRSCVRRCVTCQRAAPKVHPPYMGDLPSCRLQEGQVFQNVGIDLGGPFPIKESNRRKASTGKAYLCLFICMVTKSLHLEIVSNCTTEAFLAALNRFIARRGRPLHIYSDCGSNFIGAASILKELHRWYRSNEAQREIQNFASESDIHWHFNPPHAPHFGGLWEAGIKSAKSLLARNLSSTPLTFEELAALFCRIEAVLNSRPLCPVNEDTEGLECLTPGHFLIGRALTALPERSVLDLKQNTLGRWQLIQQRVQHFWTRWRLEYINQLQQRIKWLKKGPSLSEGDLVILKDSKVPPAVWPLARVIAVHPGADGEIRVATVRSSNGIYKRPAIKLVPLYLPHNDN